MPMIIIHTELDGTQTVLTDADDVALTMIDERKPAHERVVKRLVQNVGPGFLMSLLARPAPERRRRGNTLAVINGGKG